MFSILTLFATNSDRLENSDGLSKNQEVTTKTQEISSNEQKTDIEIKPDENSTIPSMDEDRDYQALYISKCNEYDELLNETEKLEAIYGEILQKKDGELTNLRNKLSDSLEEQERLNTLIRVLQHKLRKIKRQKLLQSDAEESEDAL